MPSIPFEAAYITKNEGHITKATLFLLCNTNIGATFPKPFCAHLPGVIISFFGREPSLFTISARFFF